ncbi:uncharacterized protein LOC132797323 [Drosophila nasuta]|uniref:Uncharacterized protein LOC117578265 n=1 Tax=Drosophila albomicans TaxID=7291 RepID=A0A6P8Y0U2_DROAB|nr:uncharacterized protein LOC117578265 [Drosophila albomicans]XP_060664998.1 uncharacterized protein LOC132797323 [Drosophila nasuta]
MKFYLLVIVAVAYLAYVSSESCVQCNSKTDVRCATDANSMMSKDCANVNNTMCYSRVLDGYTIRGCASDLDNKTLSSCNNDLECMICTFGNGCNRALFPQHRLHCLQCSGNSTNSTCATEYNAPIAVCPIYKLGDKCFVRNSNRLAAGSFQRGCLTTAHANKVCIKDGNCYTCNGGGCNSIRADSTEIPLARDGAPVSVIASLALLLFSGIASLSL